MIYKIMSKVSTNKIKESLARCVLKAQNTFILSRSITDNIIMAIECLHFIKAIKKGIMVYQA